MMNTVDDAEWVCTDSINEWNEMSVTDDALIILLSQLMKPY